MAAQNAEAHHPAPRCLLRLHERANGAALDGEGIEAWLEWEATRWRVPVEIPRDELEELVQSSTVVLEMEQHRLLPRLGLAGVGPARRPRHAGALRI